MRIRLSNGFGLVIFLGILVAPGLIAACALHSPIWALLGPVATVFAMLAIAALPIKRKVTSEEFARELERHLEGTDNDDDWDGTSSVRISDPHLEGVRLSLPDRFDSLRTPEDRDELRHIIAALRCGEMPGANTRNESKVNPLHDSMNS